MTVLSAQTIRKIKLITPFVERGVFQGMSYGLSACGYDVRIAEDLFLPSNGFSLASTIERFTIPKNVVGRVCDKSSWKRRGLSVGNTIIEPGWCGYLTLELELANIHFRTPDPKFAGITIFKGTPIAQILFEFLDEETEQPYNGKYQNQEAGPQKARFE